MYFERVAVAGLALLLAACVGPLATRGLTTKQETRLRMGMPTDVHVDAQGREIWEYAAGRMGRGTTMVRFGADGNVEEVRRVLASDNVARIVAGQSTRADVRALLGMPADVQSFPATDSEVWEYFVLDEAMRRARLKVEFDTPGTVRSVAKLIEGEGGHGGGGAQN